MAINNDPFAIAVEDAERPDFIFGQIEVAAVFVVLQKGSPKRTWIEGEDQIKDRSTEVSMIINPIEESGLTKLIQRSVITDSRGEWGKIVWPSLRDGCGLTDLRSLDNKFVKVETVKNGRKWTNREGETVEGTTFKFHAIYEDKDACVASFRAGGYTSRAPTPDISGADAMAIDMSPGAGADNPVERETAKQFLVPLVKNANGNMEALTKTLATTPIVSKYFNINSPEVLSLLPVHH